MSHLYTAQSLLQELNSLPTPEDVASRAIELALDPDSKAGDFASLFATDPGLAVTLLRTGLKRSKRGAPVLDLGWIAQEFEGELRRLCLTVDMADGEGHEPGNEPTCGGLALRQHAIAVSAGARAIATTLFLPRPDEIATIGLLCEIGSFALAAARPDGHRELRAKAAGHTAQQVREMETETFGTERGTIGHVLSEAWDLPSEVSDTLTQIDREAEQIERNCPQYVCELVTILRTARHLATVCGFAPYEGLVTEPPESDVEALMERIDVDEVHDVMRCAVEGAIALSRTVVDNPDDVRRTAKASNRELVRMLNKSETRRRDAEAANSLLQYGLKRLGDGDPLPGLMYKTMETMDFRRVVHFGLDPDEATLSVRTCMAMGNARRLPEGTTIPFDGEGLKVEEPRILLKNDGIPAFQNLRELLEVTCCVIAPFDDGSAEGRTGFLCADRGLLGHQVIPGEESALGIVADQASLLLRYERALRDIRKMATQDPLTGAATRRRLMDRLDFFMTQTQRTRIPLSMLLMDLDFFKKFNDTLGHQLGDKLLQELVKILDGSVRKGDLVARYGGEEFVVVLPSANLEQAYAVGDALRQAVFDYGQEHAEEYGNLPISISIGAAQFDGEEDATKLIGRADAALYEAKHQGRNCVVRAS